MHAAESVFKWVLFLITVNNKKRKKKEKRKKKKIDLHGLTICVHHSIEQQLYFSYRE
jgi:hypothetical protein